MSKGELRPALRSTGRRSAVPVEMDIRVGGRLPEPIEVAAYYVVSEMLTNPAKHARASVVEVGAEALGGTFSIHSPVGGGTTVRCELPFTADGGVSLASG